MKKAFCEPGNVAFCPPIALACAFTFDHGSKGTEAAITVKRSEENGGDVVFRDINELTKSFADGSLHPGDLKAAASTIMVDTLEKLSGAIKNNGDALKASKALKALQKKLAKGKK